MADQKNLIEQWFDLFVFAPIGIAQSVKNDLPKLIEQGRTQFTSQTSMAKMIGQFAVTAGRAEVDKRVKAASENLRGGSKPAPAPKAAPAPAEPAAATPATPAAPATNGASKAAAGSGGADLAIPGYDALSASQVVQRLEGLSSEELEAVRAYEESTRGRKTVLSRIAQLQS